MSKINQVTNDEIVSSSSLNTSQKIRELLTRSFTRSQISKMLNIRYQHVRNVEITPIKKS